MSSFRERQIELFTQLKTVEDQYGFAKTNKVSTPQDYEPKVDHQRNKKIKNEMKQFRGKESLFKRTDANIKECLRAKKIPDYLKNPQKWVYYSLADVTAEQMSDRTNTETALALIKQLEDRESENNEITDETGAVFKKPSFKISKTIKETPVEDNPIVFKSNKLIMPEYVVGVSRKKQIKSQIKIDKPKNTNEIKNVELVLNHLYEDDIDDEAS